MRGNLFRLSFKFQAYIIIRIIGFVPVVYCYPWGSSQSWTASKLSRMTEMRLWKMLLDRSIMSLTVQLILTKYFQVPSNFVLPSFLPNIINSQLHRSAEYLFIYRFIDAVSAIWGYNAGTSKLPTSSLTPSNATSFTSVSVSRSFSLVFVCFSK